MTKTPAKPEQQLLHLVFGGELDDVKSVTFKDLHKLDVVGFYPNYAAAHQAWLAKAPVARPAHSARAASTRLRSTGPPR